MPGRRAACPTSSPSTGSASLSRPTRPASLSCSVCGLMAGSPSSSACWNTAWGWWPRLARCTLQRCSSSGSLPTSCPRARTGMATTLSMPRAVATGPASSPAARCRLAATTGQRPDATSLPAGHSAPALPSRMAGKAWARRWSMRIAHTTPWPPSPRRPAQPGSRPRAVSPWHGSPARRPLPRGMGRLRAPPRRPGSAPPPAARICPATANTADPAQRIRRLARIIASLDPVVTVDTAVTYLAGAPGRRTFLLLDHAAEWPWLLNRTDSPWYPSLNHVQQPVPGNWHEAVAQVVSGLHVSRPGPNGRLNSYGSDNDVR